MLQCIAIWIIRTIFAFSAFIPPLPWENVMCSVGCLRDFGELWFTNTSNISTTLNPLPVDTGIISTATTDNLWRGKTLFICLNGDPADKQQSRCILLIRGLEKEDWGWHIWIHHLRKLVLLVKWTVLNKQWKEDNDLFVSMKPKFFFLLPMTEFYLTHLRGQVSLLCLL